MKIMMRIDDLFDVSYGHSLELNRLTQDVVGINFVSRTAKNNGVSAKVLKVLDIEPLEAGLITVAYGGSVLETFLQPQSFYTGFHIGILKPNVNLTNSEKLYYCACIRANKYRYNYGRQANRTLKDILIPDISEIPAWINQADVDMYDGIDAPAISNLTVESQTDNWQPFEFQSLFEIERGRGPRRKDLDGSGSTPFVSSSDSNNGVTGITSMSACHKGNTIGVNRNGSVGEAFYQPVSFCSTEDVHIFNPKFPLNPYIGLFLTTLIRREKYRFGYGRKWGIERMKKSTIHLPVKKDGTPDWDFMEQYIKSLPYSSQIE
ncbi:restriction endonuclease subunit S [Methyloglobulus sp.]|uniref:restriction endonuclease subunit S n=1 Tax=Methyloglobulus sp. TaxID=2518622 RepID=UPI0032B77FB3